MKLHKDPRKKDLLNELFLRGKSDLVVNFPVVQNGVYLRLSNTVTNRVYYLFKSCFPEY